MEFCGFLAVSDPQEILLRQRGDRCATCASHPALSLARRGPHEPERPDDHAPARVRWARLRFSIIGPLLASPPEPASSSRIDELAAQVVEAPDHRRGAPLLRQDDRAHVLRGARAGGPAPRARAQGPQARGYAPERLGPRSPRRSCASTSSTRAGATSSTTTTSPSLAKQDPRWARCRATRRCAGS